MSNKTTTRRGFLALSASLATALAGCGSPQRDDVAAESGDGTSMTSGGRETITDGTNGGHAIEVSGEEASYTAVDVIKTGDDDGDEADFYGTNAAVYAEEGATLFLEDVTVTTNGAHANAVFSYGDDTIVNISDSTIETSDNNSGGIMVTGGGYLEAKDLTVHTMGNSSAAIRSDRGGGMQTVTGGTYTTDGTGSPVIYSTATVDVSGATLTSTASQGVVVEGKNSVTLVDCELVADNNTKNSDKSDWYQAVMIYQSMSGDAAEGEARFSATKGSIDNANGDVFFVNNTVATIALTGTQITNADAEGVLLRAAAAGWGKEGSNGGHVSLHASGQELEGDLLVDDVSTLNLYLTGTSTFEGAINPEGAAGEVYVMVGDGSAWELTADSHITSLTCGADGVVTNGFTLHVGDATYEEGTESAGEEIEVEIADSTAGPGGVPGDGSGGPGGDGGEPPEKPDGDGGPGDGGEPPAKPEGDGGKSDSSARSGSSSASSNGVSHATSNG